MAKVQIKSEKLTPFGGIFMVMEQFDSALKKTSHIKAFVFWFVSVLAKWILTARQYVLNIYTENIAYARPFMTEFGWGHFPSGWNLRIASSRFVG
ncbi:MAG: hypothetical protein Q3994_06515 [Prevotella sp.]|nr:hypothetical protein [Prevotella sp.]